MQTVYIKFVSEKDRVEGFYELITRSRVGGLPGHIYQVPVEALTLLQKQQINYRRATDDEVKAAQDRSRLISETGNRVRQMPPTEG